MKTLLKANFLSITHFPATSNVYTGISKKDQEAFKKSHYVLSGDKGTYRTLDGITATFLDVKFENENSTTTYNILKNIKTITNGKKITQKMVRNLNEYFEGYVFNVDAKTEEIKDLDKILTEALSKYGYA